ncbi:MAG TPA: ABC transporter permease subunit [Thermoanaerobaculia bacterium]|nr:ABC transporter permease subunit [Thermoanaerobaculia bacterium]
MAPLIENECLKIVRRRRFTVIVAILLAILGVVAWSQAQQLARRQNRDWRIDLEQRVARYENRLRREGINPSWERAMRAELARLRYHLDRGIDPELPTAPFFARGFANVGGFLLLPLLVAVLASDIVSAESAEGTERLLLTRARRRWKVLASKAAALFIFTTLTLVVGGAIAWSASALFLHPGGWDAPVFTGFVFRDGGLVVEQARQLPLWLDTILAYGLEWYAMLCVASIGLLLSVLFRSSAASIGTMMAGLIAGTILTRMSPDWTAGKYLFVSALPLADYYSGQAPPYDGMTLGFCVGLLGAWAAGSLALAFAIFTRRDVV